MLELKQSKVLISCVKVFGKQGIKANPGPIQAALVPNPNIHHLWVYEKKKRLKRKKFNINKEQNGG